MFGKQGSESRSASGAVTIIGPGVRIEGNITFSGYLRVQGEVVGDIVCLDEHHGTTVVHGAGSVTGSIRSPGIVVGGRVQGPLHSTSSIEVHHGATVVGNVHYKQLAVHEGGAIDGQLKASAAPERAWEDRRIARSESPDIQALDGPHAHERRASDHFWNKRKLIIGGAVLAVLAAIFLWPRKAAEPEMPVYVPEPAAPVLPAPEPARVEPPAPVVPTPVPAPKPEPRAETKPEPVVPVQTPAPAAATEAEMRKADPGRVIAVQGLDPEKQSDFFFIATKEPIVLFRKQRNETGDGTRIDLARGANKRFPVTEDDLVRIAAGKDLELFYQGRKVSWGALHSGAWMRFVPLAAGKPPQ